MPRSSPEPRDTIYAVASGRPPAAVSIIRISGPDAHAAGERLSGGLPQPRVAAVRRLVHPQSGELLDDGLLLRFDAPASASGEDTVELHCHGGRAVVQAVIDALGRLPGLRLAVPGEFTRRAFENGRIDLTQAEGLADLIEAETEGQRRAALQLAEGGLRSQLERWRERLVVLSARAEREIDYADDEGGEEQIIETQLRQDAEGLVAELGEWLARPRTEPLKDGIRVVVAGPPNAGKSSLINALVGEDRVIVSPLAGTTRDHIEVPLRIGDHAFVLTDTAGLRATEDAIEAAGVSRARNLVRSADILLWLGDDPPPDHSRAIPLHARADLPDRLEIPHGRLPISIVTGQGLAELLASIGATASRLIPGSDAITINRRQADGLEVACDVVARATRSADLAIMAHGFTQALQSIDQITGRTAVEDVLDALFSRFCLGK